jgi:hypothetical protein
MTAFLKFTHIGPAIALIAILLAAAAPSLQAQQASQQVAVPIPQQISTATAVFISNGGIDAQSKDRITNTKDPNLVYDQFYAQMKLWGHYSLVATPADADLVFEIRFSSPSVTCRNYNTCLAAQIELAIYDVKTHFRIWTITEGVDAAILDSNFIKNTNQSIANLLIDVQALTPAKP